MLFSSITFLYYFLPAVLLLYFVLPKKCNNAVLLIASLIFYGWGEPRYLICMVAAIVTGYVIGILMEKTEQKGLRKLYLVIGILCCLGMLGYFKYANFFAENFSKLTGLSLGVVKVTLPIGISFYTFQILSYLVDVYWRKVAAQKSFILLAAYISMFPQLIAGPIVRYSDIEPQLKERSTKINDAQDGIRRFILGLGKKVLIANQLGEFCSIYADASEPSVLFVWMNAIAFALQIYFDFSGYSDMAIGLGKLFGFHFSENFNYPYISKSITEFWRRWHISLGTWFRDYVYIPLGGNQKGIRKQILFILIVWALTGFWHGAEWNFLFWGLYFAVLLMAEKLFLLKYLKKSKVAGHIYTLFFVLIGFVIFGNTDMREIFYTLRTMFGMGTLPWCSAETIYYVKSYLPCMVIGAAGATPIVKKVCTRWKGSMVESLFLVALLLLVTAWLIGSSFNPFLYFRF